MKHFQYALIVLTVVLMLATAQKTNAATFTVTNTNDSGVESLRQAILDANVNSAEDTIEFDQTVFNTPQTITLTSGQLTISPDNSSGTTKALTINGTGANLLTISGNNLSRVILIEQAASAVIKKVTITGGREQQGAAIMAALSYSSQGVRNFTLIDSIISGNTATGTFAEGGGLWLGGYENLIVNSTISNNTSGIYGGGIHFYRGSLRIVNSTISKNTAVLAGGGIFDFSGGKLYLTNCTIAYNQGGSFGGGVFLDPGGISPSYSPYFSARNSIVAKNTGGANNNSFTENISGSINFTDSSVFGRLPVGNIVGNSTNNQFNADPQLDPELKTNGGVIPTHALSAGSPAIDKGDNCVLNTTAAGGCSDSIVTIDQRGILRPQDGDGDGTATVDIGAYEVLRADVLSAPVAPDLLAVSDTGTSSSDNITTSRNLSFNLNGIPAGAAVEIFRDGVKIGETIAAGDVITFSDNNLPADGTFLYSVRQTLNNVTGLFSAALSVTIDNTAPTATINQATTQADPVKTQPFNFSVNFSEAIVGFDSTDVSLSGSTAGVSSANIIVTGSGTNYNAQVNNVTADGNIRASILANAVQDLAGNSNSASTGTDNTITLDTTPPTVTVNQAATQVDPTRNSQVNFTVVFSEIVNGFTSAEFRLSVRPLMSQARMLL